MNIYKFELGMLKRSILIWSLAIPAFFLFYVSFFPMMSGEDMNTIFEQFPEEFMAFFGMNPDLPVSSILGYVSLTYGMIQIPMAIQASNYGFHILSIEERELTADFLLTKPISRVKILVAKFLAAMTSLTIVNFTICLATILGTALFRGGQVVNWTAILVLLSTNIFFQLFFISVGMFISTIVKKIPSVLSLSMGLGIGLYIVSSLGTMLSSTIFHIITPYSHFAPAYILVEGTYDWSLVWISFLFIILSLVGSYFFYTRRNIASL
jgi:ABC-2 type transport system permease protein